MINHGKPAKYQTFVLNIEVLHKSLSLPRNVEALFTEVFIYKNKSFTPSSPSMPVRRLGAGLAHIDMVLLCKRANSGFEINCQSRIIILDSLHLKPTRYYNNFFIDNVEVHSLKLWLSHQFIRLNTQLIRSVPLLIMVNQLEQ